MIERRQSTLLWFGLAAPPLAWTTELVFGYGVDDATCSRASMTWGIDDHLWQAVLLLVCGLVAVAGLVAAWSSLRALRSGRGDPRGRKSFVAVWAVSAGLLFVLLIAMSGIAALVLEECRG